MYPEPSTAQKVTEIAQKGSQNRLKTIKKQGRDLGINTPGFTEYFAFGGGRQVASGARVNESTAMRVSAVYACVTYIANSVAALPKIVYVRRGKNKERANKHPLFRIIGHKPNPYQNHFEFVETLQGHVLLRGNAYAEVERAGGGQVINLWPLHPDRMRIVLWPTGPMYFYTTPGGEEVPIREVLHLRGLGNDGLIGFSPIQLARESIGLAMAEEEYRARFFGNNASPGGVLMHPQRMGKEAMTNLREQWDSAHGGLSNAHRVAVLEEGIKWQQIGLAAKDVEFMEGRKYQVLEICRLFNVRPYKIGVLEPGTVSYASVEQQSIDSYIDTVRPWVIRWELKFNDLFMESEQEKYFCEFLLDAVLRGDSRTRADVLRIWRECGIINANEWRALESYNEIDGPAGENYWMPSNFAVVGEEQLALPIAAEQPNGAAKPNGAAH